MIEGKWHAAVMLLDFAREESIDVHRYVHRQLNLWIAIATQQLNQKGKHDRQTGNCSQETANKPT